MIRSIGVRAIGLLIFSAWLTPALMASPQVPAAGTVVKVAPAAKAVTLVSESPDPGRDLADSAANILGQPFTQKELGLDANFKTAYAKIYADLDAQYQYLASKGTITDEQSEKIRLQADRTALGLLSSAQMERLKQLALQAYGLEGFSIGSVRDALQLSSEQCNLIDNVLKTWDSHLQAYGDKVAAVASANPGSDTDDPKVALKDSNKALKAMRQLKPERESLAKSKAELTTKLMELLDQKQKRDYIAMLGVKVTVTEPTF